MNDIVERKKMTKLHFCGRSIDSCRILLKHDMYTKHYRNYRYGPTIFIFNSIHPPPHATHLFSHEIQISRLCHCYIIVDQIPSEIFLIAFYRVCGNNCVYVCLQSHNNYLGDCRTPLYWKSDKDIPTYTYT